MSERTLAVAALAAVIVGGALRLAGLETAGNVIWAVSVVVMLVPLAWSVLRSLWHRDVGVDAVALVAIVGALALRQFAVGVVIVLMLAGGNALEARAAKRASRELTKLVARAPRIAHRLRGGRVEEVPVESLAVGDTVVVRAGDVVPADGVLTAEAAVLDESALTGEPLPAVHVRGETIRSGTANAGDAFELRVARPAAESAYAAIVRLV